MSGGGGRGGDLPDRFREHLAELGAPAAGDGLVVALSGGLDSLVLLHLLRWTPDLPEGALLAAHLDHAMRPGSAADARWVRGLVRAWDVPLETRRLAEPPAGEAAARKARYRFLEEVRRGAGARWIVTAHQADDQAETVLFRVLRGTGIRGLAGIRDVRADASLLRPLLPFWRSELEAYAERHRLRPRPDPTNLDPRYARNVIRHEILPRAEERVAPGTRRALVRLARLARRNEKGWRSVLREILDDVVEARSEGRFVVVRSRLLSYHPSVRARVLRALLRRLGPVPDEAGTRAALQFTSSGASGRGLNLSGGVLLAREFDRLVLSVPGAPGQAGADEVPIPGDGEGEEELVLDGRRWLARWSRTAEPSGRWVETFRTADTVLPLRLRGWRPGDRIRLHYGSKKLSKLFAEARVPAGERKARPVLEDGRGRIAWVPGVARAAADEATAGTAVQDREDEALTIAIADADDQDRSPPARRP